VGAFDPRQKTLTLSGKTGRRTVSVLQPAGLALFKRLAEGKQNPDDLLLTRDDGSNMVQAFYASSAACSGNLRVTTTWSGDPGDYTFLYYDITGAAAMP
jgi:hypothetical protein